LQIFKLLEYQPPHLTESPPSHEGCDVSIVYRIKGTTRTYEGGNGGGLGTAEGGRGGPLFPRLADGTKVGLAAEVDGAALVGGRGGSDLGSGGGEGGKDHSKGREGKLHFRLVGK